MPCGDEIHVGDIGLMFKATIKDCSTVVDVSSATTKQLIFKKPDGSIVTKTASFFTDGTDGILTYTTVSGDIDQDGFWKIQAYVVLAAGSWRSDVIRFRVYSNI